MQRLLAGMESAKRVELLLSLTSIRSEGTRGAVLDHLVRGHAVAQAAALNGERDNNIRRALVTLEGVADTVEQIKEIDWATCARSVK